MRLSAALTPLLAQAFVLTRGTTHYRTDDRGETWRSFEMPVSPSYVARPLSFHSDPSKYGYIIYQGTKCEREGGWSSICHDEVRLAYLSKHRVFLTANTDVLYQGSVLRSTATAPHRDLAVHLCP
jgi:hypothetical protein